ncbi:hypothetical protein SAMN04487948_1161 [Halogranum amylolyticum]|uniref:Uncharacterized protein n=1 Tax=Halogranum amylolyticum TaxID=660520 RepID=A0A1H8VDK0_9EURY|nr:hypothetical protein [Halogranum amylolyticum]SEP13542.1 hypothetical protein SAMN04487948_1161 [Halogranum amylolyticum]
MRGNKWILFGVLLIGVVFLLIPPVRYAAVQPIVFILKPLRFSIGLLPTALIAATTVGLLVEYILVSRSDLGEAEQYLVAAILGMVSIGSWVVWNTGTSIVFNEAQPDLVIPFLLRIPFSSTNLYFR